MRQNEYLWSKGLIQLAELSTRCKWCVWAQGFYPEVKNQGQGSQSVKVKFTMGFFVVV